jgi:hypothetical protein
MRSDCAIALVPAFSLASNEREREREVFVYSYKHRHGHLQDLKHLEADSAHYTRIVSLSQLLYLGEVGTISPKTLPRALHPPPALRGT